MKYLLIVCLTFFFASCSSGDEELAGKDPVTPEEPGKVDGGGSPNFVISFITKAEKLSFIPDSVIQGVTYIGVNVEGTEVLASKDGKSNPDFQILLKQYASIPDGSQSWDIIDHRTVILDTLKDVQITCIGDYNEKYRNGDNANLLFSLNYYDIKQFVQNNYSLEYSPQNERYADVEAFNKAGERFMTAYCPLGRIKEQYALFLVPNEKPSKDGEYKFQFTLSFAVSGEITGEYKRFYYVSDDSMWENKYEELF